MSEEKYKELERELKELRLELDSFYFNIFEKIVSLAKKYKLSMELERGELR